jgi:uncharacterized protein
MADARALLRVFDELLWSLRRGGFKISVAGAIDALRAVREVGLDDRTALLNALAAVIVHSPQERPRFDRIARDFFARSSPHESLAERLAHGGFSESEVAEIMDLLERLAASAGEEGARLGALLEGGPDLDRLFHLAGIARTLSSVDSHLQLGFFTYRALDALGFGGARDKLTHLRAHLRDALGRERGDALVDALESELERTAEDVRAHLRDSVSRRDEELAAGGRPTKLDAVAFTSLTDAEVLEVRRAVRTFGERLRGAERVRARRAKRGRVDLHRTMRRAMTTGGVPFHLVRKRRRRDRPKLFLLCDVSDSVRAAARFMLELTYVAHELFERTRSFVFVSELGETTHLFESETVTHALGHAYGGGVVSVTDNSNYGRVLRAFEERYLADVDRRTTVVVLGDGRTNYHEDGAEVLDRVRARARSLVWLCPEARAGWMTGDSAMPRYAPRCTRLFEVKNTRELEIAARAIAGTR